MEAKKDKGGRPYKHTPEEAARLCDGYFASCAGVPLIDPETGKQAFSKSGVPLWEKAPKPFTMYGLAIALGSTLQSFTTCFSRLADKGNRTEEEEKLFETYAQAREKVRNYAESRLFDKDGSNGAKFWLSVNAGWKDTLDINATIDRIEVVLLDDEE